MVMSSDRDAPASSASASAGRLGGRDPVAHPVARSVSFAVMNSKTPLEDEVGTLIVEALNLEVAPADIHPEAPLFREGLELDSIDMLEIALEVSKRYGFQLRSDDADNVKIFASLRSLTAHIEKNRTK